MAKYEILEEIATLNQRRDSALCLDKVKYASGDIRFELRVWTYRPLGEPDPGRGIILRGEDLRALYEALKEYFK